MNIYSKLSLIRASRCFAVFFIWQIGLANIDNLKGTYSILKDDYKYLSVIHGAIAVEKDYLMKLYDYGSLGKAISININGEEHDIPDVKNSLAIVQLIHLFFHRANPLSTGRGDFALTKSLGLLNLENKKDFVTVMAWLIGMTYFKIDHEDAADIKFDKAIQKTWAPISKSSGNSITLTKVVDFVNQAIAQARTPDAIFGVPLIYMVLLGIVYKIVTDDKALIKLFYEQLDEQAKKNKRDSIFVDGKIPDGWINEKFSSANAAEFEENVKNIDFKKNMEIVNSYEKIVYIALLPGDYPAIAPYGSAAYFYDPTDKTKMVYISDCMENVLRNILNVVFYKKESVEFDIVGAVKRLGISPKLKLLAFYKKYQRALDVDLQEIHNNWMYVVSNIPFVAYCNCIGHKERGIQPPDKFGYIKIPKDALNKEFFDKNYIRMSQDNIVYEVVPSLRNVIIIYNHLLGLKLFEHENGDTDVQKIETALTRGDFVKYYFPELCKKLKIDFSEGWEDQTENIDKIDQNERAVDTLMKFHETSETPDFKLTTRTGHGEFQLVAVEAKKEFFKVDCLKIEDKRIYTLPYLYCSLNSDEILQGLRDKTIEGPDLFKTIFWMPIDNSDFVGDLGGALGGIDGKLADLLIYLVSKIHDTYNRNNLFGSLFRKGIGFEQAISIARREIRNERSDIRFAGIHLYLGLVCRGRGEIFSEALASAYDGISSENPDILNVSIMLLRDLIEKGYEKAFEAAIKAAAHGANSENSDVSRGSGYLFEALFKKIRELLYKEYANEEVIKFGKRLAKEGLSSGNQEIVGMARELQDKLATLEAK